jgi:DNA-binding GntR family transcriptional regulator
MTIQKALHELDDVVVRWQGRGVFVRETATAGQNADPLKRVMDQLDSLQDSLQGLEDRVAALESERKTTRS